MFVFQFFDAFSNQGKGYNTLVKSQDFVQAQTFVIHVLTKKKNPVFYSGACGESFEKPKKKKTKPYFLSYCDVIFDYHCKHLHFCSDLSV